MKKQTLTTIGITHQTWKDLNMRKKVGESFEDVIKRMLLEEPEVKEVKNDKETN